MFQQEGAAWTFWKKDLTIFLQSSSFPKLVLHKSSLKISPKPPIFRQLNTYQNN